MTIFDWFSRVLSTTTQSGSERETVSMHDEIMFGGEDFYADDLDFEANPGDEASQWNVTSPSFSDSLGAEVDTGMEAGKRPIPYRLLN